MKKYALALCFALLINSFAVAQNNQWLLTDGQVKQILSWAREDCTIGASRRLQAWAFEGPQEIFYIETPAFALYRIAINFYKYGMPFGKSEIDKIIEQYSSTLNVYVLCYGSLSNFADDCVLTLFIQDPSSTELKRIRPIYKDVIYVTSNFPDYPIYKALIKFSFDTKYISRDSTIRFEFIGEESSSLSDFIDLNQVP